MKVKFQSKLLRRVFNSWSAFKNIYLEQKRAFKKSLVKLNLHNSKLAFNFWKDNVEGKKRKMLKKRQIIMTEETQMTIDDQGTTEDVVFTQERKKLEIVSQFRSLNKKTIKKVIS